MTSSDARTLISVRGHAQRTVDADQAAIHAVVSQTRGTKEAASAAVTVELANLVEHLASLGGVVLTAQGTRMPLTWSAQSLRTSEEFDSSSGSYQPTGRHVSAVSLLITVRDFGLLGQVEGGLTSRDAVAVQAVQWSADDDNPEWSQVRAEAIRAAIGKGQDYAAALGGSVVGIAHLADAGLLGGEDPGPGVRPLAAAAMMRGAHRSRPHWIRYRRC